MLYAWKIQMLRHGASLSHLRAVERVVLFEDACQVRAHALCVENAARTNYGEMNLSCESIWF